MGTKTYHTSKEAQAILGLPWHTLLHWEKRLAIPVMQHKRKRYYDKRTLDLFEKAKALKANGFPLIRIAKRLKR